MKTVEIIEIDYNQVNRELAEFEDLLKKYDTLKEKTQILPFFKERKQLSAIIGSIHSGMSPKIKLAHEFPLFGNFSCDVLSYDLCTKQYAFIEFEDAQTNSIFKKNGNKAMPEWAQRFEHGFSQLVDWFWTLDSFKGTDGIRGMFEEEFLNYHGILIIGRSKYIDDYQHRNRLDWRRTKVLINSRPILCITYDELLEMLKIRVAVMQLKA